MQAMFMNDENKHLGQAIKIARETTNNQQKKYNSVKHLQRQQFSFTKTSIKVSLKLLSRLSLSLFCFTFSRPPRVFFFKDELLEAKFSSTAKFITKYSSERFLFYLQ